MNLYMYRWKPKVTIFLQFFKANCIFCSSSNKLKQNLYSTTNNFYIFFLKGTVIFLRATMDYLNLLFSKWTMFLFLFQFTFVNLDYSVLFLKTDYHFVTSHNRLSRDSSFWLTTKFQFVTAHKYFIVHFGFWEINDSL